MMGSFISRRGRRKIISQHLLTLSDRLLAQAQSETLSNLSDMVCECEAGTIKYMCRRRILSMELASSSVFKLDASMAYYAVGPITEPWMVLAFIASTEESARSNLVKCFLTQLYANKNSKITKCYLPLIEANR